MKLRYLTEWARARQANAAHYSSFFVDHELDANIKLPSTPPGHGHVYNQFTIRAPRRDALRAFLKEKGIPTEVYYPSPLHLQSAFAYLGHQAGDFPVSEGASREVVALPIYPELRKAQLDMIVDSISDFYSKE